MRLGEWWHLWLWRHRDDSDVTEFTENIEELKQAWRELIRTIQGGGCKVDGNFKEYIVDPENGARVDVTTSNGIGKAANISTERLEEMRNVLGLSDADFYMLTPAEILKRLELLNKTCRTCQFVKPGNATGYGCWRRLLGADWWEARLDDVACPQYGEREQHDR